MIELRTSLLATYCPLTKGCLEYLPINMKSPWLSRTGRRLAFSIITLDLKADAGPSHTVGVQGEKRRSDTITSVSAPTTTSEGGELRQWNHQTQVGT